MSIFGNCASCFVAPLLSRRRIKLPVLVTFAAVMMGEEDAAVKGGTRKHHPKTTNLDINAMMPVVRYSFITMNVMEAATINE